MPRPSPLLAPLTSPAISVKENEVGKMCIRDSDSDYAAYLTSTSTKLTYSDDAAEFYKSYSVKLESVGDYYCLFIKLGEGEEPTLENSRDEVIQQMTEDLYKVGENEKANIERMYYVRRQESGLKIYDKFIEAIYEYNYNTFYSTTLSETDFDEYKTSRKNKKKIVAVVDGLEITPDQMCIRDRF